jgi:AmmeMemoRadiSam system protein B
METNMKSGIRQPAVCGSFYPKDLQELLQTVDTHLACAVQPEPCLAAICPHAGYMYSGAVAGEVLAGVTVPPTVILLGPKHRRGGPGLAVDTSQAWRFPFGDVELDEALCRELTARAKAVADASTHRDEHSLEVQVPFLWRRRPDVRLVPMLLGHETMNRLAEIGAALAHVARQAPGDVLLLASTDMSHYLPQDVAKKLDLLALERIEALDPAGLLETVLSRDISMCGVLPTVAVLHAAKILGATQASLVRYTTSGQTSGDLSSVVGYAGYVIR